MRDADAATIAAAAPLWIKVRRVIAIDVLVPPKSSAQSKHIPEHPPAKETGMYRIVSLRCILFLYRGLFADEEKKCRKEYVQRKHSCKNGPSWMFDPPAKDPLCVLRVHCIRRWNPWIRQKTCGKA